MVKCPECGAELEKNKFYFECRSCGHVKIIEARPTPKVKFR